MLKTCVGFAFRSRLGRLPCRYGRLGTDHLEGACGEVKGNDFLPRAAAFRQVVAASLRRLGLTGVPCAAYPGAAAAPPMVVMLLHQLESFAILLGVLRQGYPLLPLSVTHGNRPQLLRRYADAMELFEPVAAVTDSELVSELKSHRPALQVVSARELLNGPVEPYEALARNAERLMKSYEII